MHVLGPYQALTPDSCPCLSYFPCRFADREFYKDWWNSKSMDEFARNWNRPVHQFLLKHVYASTIQVGAPKSVAIFFTFLLSSLMHELVMAIVTGKIRGYLFLMQMAQLPLIVLGQTKFIKDSPARGNLLFWIGLIVRWFLFQTFACTGYSVDI